MKNQYYTAITFIIILIIIYAIIERRRKKKTTTIYRFNLSNLTPRPVGTYVRPISEAHSSKCHLESPGKHYIDVIMLFCLAEKKKLKKTQITNIIPYGNAFKTSDAIVKRSSRRKYLAITRRSMRTRGQKLF